MNGRGNIFRKKWIVMWAMIWLLSIVLSWMPECVIAQAATDSYTIKASTEPCDQSKSYTTYNSYTKNYYTILSYLRKLEEKGGGTLTLKKGTYKISNTLYVPSNVTIKFKDGVVIKKLTKTGTTSFSASKSIFQLAAPSKAEQKGVYSKYKGVHDVAFVGKGTVVMDLTYDEDTVGIMMGHNSDVSISGITFQNMHAGHFIEMDASRNVVVENCIFQNHKDSPNNNKEAINLDTPDKETKGFHADWSSYDKTANKNVVIQNCTFKNLERAIGTHKYSEGYAHNKIQILNNKITNCDQDAIRVMNWTNTVIKGNQIDTVGDNTKQWRGILVSGAYGLQITKNEFRNVARAVQIIPWKNNDAGSKYDIIYNDLTEKEKELLSDNVLINGSEYFIRWNKIYDVFDRDTEKIYLKESDGI